MRQLPHRCLECDRWNFGFWRVKTGAPRVGAPVTTTTKHPTIARSVISQQIDRSKTMLASASLVPASRRVAGPASTSARPPPRPRTVKVQAHKVTVNHKGEHRPDLWRPHGPRLPRTEDEL